MGRFKFLFMMLMSGLFLAGQAKADARLQVIHNAADPAAKMVDVYLGETLLLNDFEFRTATNYIDAPAGSPITIGIAPSTSMSVNDTITSFTLTLEDQETYVAIANGVLDPNNFAANPDEIEIGFTLFAKSGMREAAAEGGVDFVVVHGATDAPAVDVIARGVGNLVDNAPYGAITDYINVPAASYTLDITPAEDNETVVASFTADLSGLEGGAAVVFASGFLTPTANQNGELFGIYAALPDGNVVEFPVTTARLQVIHNAADPAAEMVDIYLNGQMLLEDFAFRAATPYIDVPAQLGLNIGVAPAGSESYDDILTSFDVNFAEGGSYVALANGVLDSSMFAANPDMEDISFTLFAKDMMREAAAESGVDFVVVHGATDAPAVDVIARGVGNLVDNAPYGAITDYINVPAASYTLDITPAEDNHTIVASFTADLSGLEGGAAVVFASGFLTPTANQNGELFGIYAALPDGNVVEFPVTTARLQVIHNAADPAAEMVDIYLNGQMLLEDFAFRAATPYIDVPAQLGLNIGVAPASSESYDDILTSFDVSFDEGGAYVALANGVLDPNNFAANPDEIDIAFTLFSKNMMREAAAEGGVDFVVVHGATDAPAVDVIARGVGNLVDNAPYGAITDYINVPAASYTLDITPAEDNHTIVASFTADLSGLEGGAAVVFASGFLTPTANMNGKLFGIYAALPDGNVVEFPVTTARLQVIHNAADPAAEMVDIYLNGQMLLEDFAFRAATPYIDVPAQLGLNIGVAPAGSESYDDILTSFDVNFAEGGSYVALANGVLDSSMFAANPDMEDISFTLFAKDMMREAAAEGGVDFVVVHGATDAPAVDVLARGVGALVEGAPYGAITEYINVPAASYTLDVTPAGMNETVVASFTADLSGLEGGAAVVFASGFLTPTANMNGKLFGIYAALPDGNVVEFPVTTARLQVIHNAADPAAEMVDIYLNGQMLLEDFAFRAATPYIDVPAQLGLNIGVAPAGSESYDDILTSFDVNFAEGGTYVAIANGVLDSSMFAANPDMEDISFTLFAKDMMREAAAESGVDFVVVHGATDAPAVDVLARGVGALVEGAPYGAITEYINVPAASYTLDVTPAGMNETVVASFTADLSGLEGGAAVVFASGFLTPTANQNGELFGIYAALPDGNVVEFPVTTARLQVIHNAADPAAEEVDIYLNGQMLLEDFAFRAATSYIDVPAQLGLNIGVAAAGSESYDDILTSFDVNFAEGGTYVAIANGVLDPGSFEENPDGEDIAFTLFAKDMMRETGTGDNVDFVVLHGATDAPAVDVIARGVGTLVDNAAYGDITEYLSVGAASYTLDITPAEDNGTIVASYEADLSGLGGGSAVVFASGFLTPDNDQNGPMFGLYAALADGQVVAFENVTSIESAALDIPTKFELQQNFPNPFNPSTKISFALPASGLVKLSVYNVLGEEVATLVNRELTAGVYEYTFDARNLGSGIYFYKIQSGSFTDVRRMTLIK